MSTSELKATNPVSDSIPTRASLVNRLKEWSDAQSWKDFHQTYSRLIYAVAIRSGLSESEAQDALQETLISVAKQMKTFRLDPNRSFKGWLMVIARRRIVDQFRRRPKLKQVRTATGDGSRRTALVERMADPTETELELLCREEWQHHLSALALRRAKTKSGARDYFLFHQQVIKGRSPQEAAKQVGASVAYAYVAKYRVTRLIKKEVRALEKRL